MQTQNGLTLPELLLTSAILMILSGMVAPSMSRFMESQAAVARANNIAGLLREARASAVAAGPVLVCAEKTDCQSFEGRSTGLKLVRDDNDNRRHDDGEAVLDRLQLGDNESVYWRSFRMRPWLRFGHRGVAWYQNGHFLVCHKSTARKVVVSTQGRARVELADRNARQRCDQATP